MNGMTSLELLKWQIDLGADEAIGDAPINRFDLPNVPRPPKSGAAPRGNVIPVPPAEDPVQVAEAMATSAASLGALNDALDRYEHCELKRGARNLVFADGRPDARVMIIGEAPGRDEDIQGKPFVGRAGHLLDQMFAAIDLARDAADAERALYITNILPWRPPQNRDPKPEEIQMLMPFVRRHVDLAAPDILVAMGNISCQGLLGRRGITRMRGTWAEAMGRPVLPMFHPAYLLRNPHAKRDAWHDLLMIQNRLRNTA